MNDLGRSRKFQFSLKAAIILMLLAGMLVGAGVWYYQRINHGKTISKFEYEYNGGGKTTCWGELSKTRFHIQLASSYPGDYDKDGITSERCWLLIEWFYKYGTKANQQSNGYFNATFTKFNGETEEKVFDVDQNHIVFSQILKDCEDKVAGQADLKDGENEIVNFEYTCDANRKQGEMSSEKFKIQRTSSDALAYDKQGATPERTWELVKWLYKYGTDTRDDPPRNSYKTTFHLRNGKRISKTLNSERDVLWQILKDLGDSHF